MQCVGSRGSSDSLPSRSAASGERSAPRGAGQTLGIIVSEAQWEIRMACWLVKSDPDDYSAADLERDGTTDWTGVKNALAQRHLRAMKPPDRVLVYHTGEQRAIVALAVVARTPVSDPTDATGKRAAVRLRFDRWLPRPVPLADVKADPTFRDFGLVRLGRLSVMPVTDDQWARLMTLAAQRRSR